MALFVGCISGAAEVGEYDAWLKGAGFQGELVAIFHSQLWSSGVLVCCCDSERFCRSLTNIGIDVLIVDKKNDLNIYKERDAEEQGASCCLSDRVCCGTGSKDEEAKVKEAGEKRVADIDFNEWAGELCFSILFAG